MPVKYTANIFRLILAKVYANYNSLSNLINEILFLIDANHIYVQQICYLIGTNVLSY